MASTRAAEVAEVLWELKRADKVATLTSIARRAGFSAGTNGRTIKTCLKTVRRDWPHLQWWRAIEDTCFVEKGSEHEEKLRECGFQLAESNGHKDSVTIVSLDEYLMSWEEAASGNGAVAGNGRAAG